MDVEADFFINVVKSRILMKNFFAEKIRVGRDFQAVCPEYIPAEERKPENETNDRALLVWSPSKDISDEQRKYK